MSPYRTAAAKAHRPTPLHRWLLRALPVALATVKRAWRRQRIATAQAAREAVATQITSAVDLHARYLAGEMGAESYAHRVLAVVGAARVAGVVDARGDAARIGAVLRAAV